VLGLLLDAIAPRICCLCGVACKGNPWLCDACAARLMLLREPLCLRCGRPRPLACPVCVRCPDWPAGLFAVRSGAPHAGAAKDLVLALRDRELAAGLPLAALAGAGARALPLPADTHIVPVPQYRWKGLRRWGRAGNAGRGFHPAAEIARHLSRDLGLRVASRQLRRVRPEADELLSLRGRERAVRGAFRSRGDAGAHPWLIVDDTFVTGATIGACARALYYRGARRIWAVTATRLLPSAPR